jgi:hypothetical protein
MLQLKHRFSHARGHAGNFLSSAGTAGEPVTFPVEGMDGGSVSMMAVQLG